MTFKKSLLYEETHLCVSSSLLILLVRPLKCETREHMVAFSLTGPSQPSSLTSCSIAGEF